MKAKQFLFAAGAMLMLAAQSSEAQEVAERLPHASQWLVAPVGAATQVSFGFDDPGTPYRVRWGMDTAWNDGNNVRRGVYHIGAENLGYGRLSFQPTDSVGDDLKLSSAQQRALNSRINNMKRTGVTTVLLNSDPNDPDKLALYYYGKPKNWYNVIKATVVAAQAQGMTIEAIAPMNEPDYTYNGQGTKQHFLEVVKLLRADPFFDDIRISAGNTLNTDPALEWYNYMKPYVDEGNTHQLAGSFDNYARFFETVRADGKIATADELHNVMEAFVAVEYGLQNGIWWGFDGVMRGRYCKATSGGQRLGYGENRTKWTAGAVYRLPNGEVDAFLGSSERQANTTDFEIVSRGKDVFFDGYGPVRAYGMQVPGGTGYQIGQTNAERLIRITSGDDVPLGPIATGDYIIMNVGSRLLMSTGGNTNNGASILQTRRHNSRRDEFWTVEPVPDRVGGDFSGHFVTNQQGSRLLDVYNSNLNNGGTICAYPGGKGEIEQWYFSYAGNGDYYIQSRFSGLYLCVDNTREGTAVVQRALNSESDNFRWRLIPTDAKLEAEAPAAPTGLSATPHGASMLLEWMPNADADIASYIVLRREVKDDGSEVEWQTLCNSTSETRLLDNMCLPGKTYAYKLRAVDRTGNRSEASEPVVVDVAPERGLIARYAFDRSVADSTANQYDGVGPTDFKYGTLSSVTKEGTSSLNLNSSGREYIAIPYAVGNQREMTVAVWLRWRGGTKEQHIFDFGNGTDQCVYLTPENPDGKIALVLRNGDEVQTLCSTSAMNKSSWRHLVVTMSATEVKMYLNGEEIASTEDITLRPADLNPGLCYIGRSQDPIAPGYYGYMDDFRVYNYALSADEVAVLYDPLYTAISSPATQATTSPVVRRDYFSLDGRRQHTPVHGISVVKEHHADGSVTTRKQVR